MSIHHLYFCISTLKRVRAIPMDRAFHPVKHLAKPLAFHLARITSILANSGDRYFWQAFYFSARLFSSDTSTRNFDERRRQPEKIATVSKPWVWNRRCHRSRDNNPWLLASKFIFLVEEGGGGWRTTSQRQSRQRKENSSGNNLFSTSRSNHPRDEGQCRAALIALANDFEGISYKEIFFFCWNVYAAGGELPHPETVD